LNRADTLLRRRLFNIRSLRPDFVHSTASARECAWTGIIADQVRCIHRRRLPAAPEARHPPV